METSKTRISPRDFSWSGTESAIVSDRVPPKGIESS